MDDLRTAADEACDCLLNQGAPVRWVTLSVRDAGQRLTVSLEAETDEDAAGPAAENAAITRAILAGTERGHKRNAVLLNAGQGLVIGGKAETMEQGVALAAELIDSGAALAKLEAFIAASNR